MDTPRITVMANASGSWSLIGRFDDSPGMRANLSVACAQIHVLTDRHTHFKMVDAQGKTLATLRNGMTRFESAGGN